MPTRLRHAAGLLVAWVPAGCGGGDTAPAPPPPVVEIATPRVRDVTEYFRYTGTLQAVKAVEVRARVSGFLSEVHFDESTDVEAGALLFTIEQAPYTIAVGLAEAALARARAARDLDAARLQRTETAFEANAANEIELIESRAALAQAEALVKAAEQELAAARLDFSYTEVRSPIAGRVDRNYVDAGNLVGRSEPTLLARVVTLDPMHVWFDVSESIALQYLSAGRDGSVDASSPPVEVGLEDEEGFPHRGRIDFVDSVLDQGTGTLAVRAVLPNPTGKLYPGLFARIRVPWRTRPDALLVREEAIGTGLEGKYVLTLDAGDVVRRRPVTLGPRQQDGTVVVRSGLEPDARYVVRGLQKARPGAPVQPRPFEPEAGDSAAGGTAP